jgi:hypothetical protein
MKLVHERERGCELLAQKRARQQEREREREDALQHVN